MSRRRHIVTYVRTGMRGTSVKEQKVFRSYPRALAFARELGYVSHGAVWEIRIDGWQRRKIDQLEALWERFYMHRSNDATILGRRYPEFVTAIRELLRLCDVYGFQVWCQQNDQLVRQALKPLISPQGRAFHKELLKFLPGVTVSVRK